ncbi:helix-turn-helix transcriptional regulator [Paenibacillus bouchesdurhonensis]|uniref:helix-turn-helix transcriptional regulator n=1 Tax=Paenibacillus bouchesdurhonensis TaxID=1870990 RepID=UPI000DA63A30|nr:AraC family transcriptional regulator [Paenibacillus bouchesdurhonensis]
MSEKSIVELKTPPFPYYLDSGCSNFQVGDHHPNRKKLGFFDLLIMLKGELHIGENNQQWTLSAGETLLLLPDGEHYSVKPCDQNTIFYWVHFGHVRREKPLIMGDNSIEDKLYPSVRDTLCLPKTTRLALPQAAFNLLQQLINSPIGSASLKEQRLFLDLLAILEDEPNRSAISVTDRLAESVAAYIQENYRSKITNKQIAEALHFHPNYIVQCMRAKYGCSPSVYLLQYRVERAKRLLITTDWSMERIADEVGFLTGPYFSTCFKRIEGLSPFQFRKQYLANY